MTPRRPEEWHRHGLSSPDEVAAMIAERIDGRAEVPVTARAEHDEPSYADFLGEQV